jgi:hypothetical protein
MGDKMNNKPSTGSPNKKFRDPRSGGNKGTPATTTGVDELRGNIFVYGVQVHRISKGDTSEPRRLLLTMLGGPLIVGRNYT